MNPCHLFGHKWVERESKYYRFRGHVCTRCGESDWGGKATGVFNTARELTTAAKSENIVQMVFECYQPSLDGGSLKQDRIISTDI